MKIVSWMIKLSAHKQLCVELTHRWKGRIKKFLDKGCPEELSIMTVLLYKSVLSNEVAKPLTTNGYKHSKCG